MKVIAKQCQQGIGQIAAGGHWPFSIFTCYQPFSSAAKSYSSNWQKGCTTPLLVPVVQQRSQGPFPLFRRRSRSTMPITSTYSTKYSFTVQRRVLALSLSTTSLKQASEDALANFSTTNYPVQATLYCILGLCYLVCLLQQPMALSPPAPSPFERNLVACSINQGTLPFDPTAEAERGATFFE